MLQKYTHLEHHGRRIFNATYDIEVLDSDITTDSQLGNEIKQEAESAIQDLSSELLRIFHDVIIAIVREKGEIPNVDDFITSVRRPLFQGVFQEAIILSENQKKMFASGVGRRSPVSIAVNKTREKIESKLRIFAIQGVDAAAPIVNRMLQDFRGEKTEFQRQAEEALRKYTESEAARKSISQHLNTAIGKFRENLQFHTDQRALLEEKKKELEEERDLLIIDIEAISSRYNGLQQKNRELSNLFENMQTELSRANEQLQWTEQEIKRLKKSEEGLNAIKERIKLVARSGDNGPEQLASILNELERLRKQEAGFAMVYRQNQELKAINEGLHLQLREAPIQSILTQGKEIDQRITRSYYDVLEEYFLISLRESPQDIKNISALEDAKNRLRGVFVTMRSRDLDPITVGTEELKRLKQDLKKRRDLQEHDIYNFTIEGVYKEVIGFLEGIGQNKWAVSMYQKMARDEVRV